MASMRKEKKAASTEGRVKIEKNQGKPVSPKAASIAEKTGKSIVKDASRTLFNTNADPKLLKSTVSRITASGKAQSKASGQAAKRSGPAALKKNGNK